VVESQPVEGFATTIEADPELAEDDLALRLRDAAMRLGTGIPGDQGFVGDLLHKLIARVRGRKLIEDHGLHEVEVPWLTLHVPAGGSARLQTSDARNSNGGIKFSLAGMGLGNGWSLSSKLRQDFLERTHCLAVVETFRIHVRSYARPAAPADPEYRSDVVAHVGTSARELARCPFCTPVQGDPPLLAQKAGPAIDLSADPVGQKRSEELVLGGTSDLEIGLKATLPGNLGLSAGVTCKREVSLTCTLDFSFAGRKRYWPMRFLRYADLPFWRVD
jgi:hypothetical protein